MLKILPLVLFALWLTPRNSFAQTFSLGKFSVAESRVQVELNDFVISTKNPKIKAAWVPGSVQWIRNENNLLVPRALLKIFIAEKDSLVHIEYKNEIVVPVKKNNYYSSDIYVDLFNPDAPSVFSGSDLLDKITIEARSAATGRSKQLIDYSCSPYDLKISGVDGEYLSIGCKMNRVGKFGNEHPRLEIMMSTTNLRPINQAKPPYTIYLEDNSPVELKMKGADQKIKTFHLEAKVSKRLYRLKTAVGFGPYVYESQLAQEIQRNKIAPSFMLYAKYDINETASIKGFDALLYSKKSLFNNSGLYFSYDLADALDGRLLINTLVGFQGLHYKFNASSGTEFRLIYPQGFEIIYKHAFVENYSLTYGMFLSTNANEKYTNTWVRYGKSGFLELNYINWGHAESKIKMWGLSVGIPFFSAL